jgi:transcriptional regulator with XRE-family HTH domain
MQHRNLSDAFKATGMSQEQFAAALGISQSYLSRLMARRMAPSLRLAVRIASRAGVPVESLARVRRTRREVA